MIGSFESTSLTFMLVDVACGSGTFSGVTVTLSLICCSGRSLVVFPGTFGSTIVAEFAVTFVVAIAASLTSSVCSLGRSSGAAAVSPTGSLDSITTFTSSFETVVVSKDSVITIDGTIFNNDGVSVAMAALVTSSSIMIKDASSMTT